MIGISLFHTKEYKKAWFKQGQFIPTHCYQPVLFLTRMLSDGFTLKINNNKLYVFVRITSPCLPVSPLGVVFFIQNYEKNGHNPFFSFTPECNSENNFLLGKDLLILCLNLSQPHGTLNKNTLPSTKTSVFLPFSTVYIEVYFFSLFTYASMPAQQVIIKGHHNHNLVLSL